MHKFGSQNAMHACYWKHTYYFFALSIITDDNSALP